MNRYFINVFVIIILGYSCSDSNSQKFNNTIWKIEKIISDTTIVSCFRSDIISFKRDGKSIGVPGVEHPYDNAKYRVLDNENIEIFNQRDCYFNGKYKYSVKKFSAQPSRLIIHDDLLQIFATEQSFEYGNVGGDLFSKFLDSLSWNSPFCISERDKILRSKACE